MSSHACPGCGKPGIASARLSCPRCWFKLPLPLRTKIWRTFRGEIGSGPGSPEHRAAIQEALDLYAAS